MGVAICDIELVKEEYSTLEVFEREGDVVFSGELILNHVFNDVHMTGKFFLEIVVPRDFPLALPITRELSNSINKNYPHCSPNGELCLASELELRIFFLQTTSMYDFIEKYIIPYLYTYRFYEEYGVYPFGERSHGTMGNLEYLKELFGVETWKQVLDIMLFVVNSSYRGHLLCPCGSNKRIRNCHGDILKKAMDAGLQDECSAILTELSMKYDGKERNG